VLLLPPPLIQPAKLSHILLERLALQQQPEPMEGSAAVQQ